MISIRGVSKSYEGFEAIHNISIEVPKGSVHGLIGENGSGKTTLIKCMTGIYKPDQGEILVDGEPVYENPEVKKRMGYVADYNQYFPSYTLEQMADFYGDLYPSFDRKQFGEYNHLFRLDLSKRVSQLSKGQKMRLAIMLNLAVNPDVLILDEPTSGLDAIAKKEVLDLIISEVERREMTVFITSHHLGELEKLCDSITIIHNGTVKYQDEIDLIKGEIRKLQIVFPEGLPEGFTRNYKVLDMSNTGSIYSVVFRKVTEEIIEKLRSDGAVLVEEIPITLEEVFIYTAKEESGD